MAVIDCTFHWEIYPEFHRGRQSKHCLKISMDYPESNFLIWLLIRIKWNFQLLLSHNKTIFLWDCKPESVLQSNLNLKSHLGTTSQSRVRPWNYLSISSPTLELPLNLESDLGTTSQSRVPPWNYLSISSPTLELPLNLESDLGTTSQSRVPPWNYLSISSPTLELPLNLESDLGTTSQSRVRPWNYLSISSPTLELPLNLRFTWQYNFQYRQHSLIGYA